MLKSLEENVVYFQSPTEVKALSEINKKNPVLKFKLDKTFSEKNIRTRIQEYVYEALIN